MYYFFCNWGNKYAITDTKLYVLVVTLSTQENVNLLQQLESGFKRIINWNKYNPKATIDAWSQYFDSLIDPNFQVVKRLFALSFENNNSKTEHTGYFLSKVEIKDYNVVINEKNVFLQLVKSDSRTYGNIPKIAPGQGDDYRTGCLLDYLFFKEHYKMIAIDLSKQQALDADRKAIQQVNIHGNLDRDGSTTMFFVIEKAKDTIFDFPKRTLRVL